MIELSILLIVSGSRWGGGKTCEYIYTRCWRKPTQIKILVGWKRQRVACKGFPSGLPCSGKAGHRKTKAGQSQGEYTFPYFQKPIFSATFAGEEPLSRIHSARVDDTSAANRQNKKPRGGACLVSCVGIKLENNDAEPRARCIAANNTSTQQHC